MSYENSREFILQFIMKYFHSCDLERHKDNCNRCIGTTDYSELISYNELHINTLNQEELNDLLALIRLIENFETYNMDKDNMGTFRTSGFVFNMLGCLIIFNEQ